MTKFVETSEWKKAIRNGGNIGVRKQVEAETEDLGDRTLKFTISTPDVDRYGTRFVQEGIILTNYKRNPVVCWNHDENKVIGRCVDIGIENGKLKATVEFVPENTKEFGDLAEGVFQMLKNKFLNAASIGCRILDYDDEDEDAVSFTSVDLYEFSIVTCPGNAEALIEPGQRKIELPENNSEIKISENRNLAWSDPTKRKRAIEALEIEANAK